MKVFFLFDYVRKNIRNIFCCEYEKWEMNFMLFIKFFFVKKFVIVM